MVFFRRSGSYKNLACEDERMSEEAGIYARHSPYLERVVQVGYASGKVLRVTFPAEQEADADPAHPLLDRIFAYLEGDRVNFETVEIALTLPTDQRAVLETIRSIPYGEEVTVEEVARMTPRLDASDEDDLMTVRHALAENPAPILLPDHRVRDGPGAPAAGIEQKLRRVEGL